ncbi:MAG TPA: hypothetical protein VMF30_18945 [Pirellulales bacterium]|nr:hypothetical protein [Pirellulales bacterium]
MLRITRIERAGAAPVIKLEGKLLAPWVDELLQACDARDPAGNPPSLDLSALSYADAAGTAVLRALRDRHVTIVAGSGYVAELLKGGAS